METRFRLVLAAILLAALVISVVFELQAPNRAPTVPTADIAAVQTEAVRAFSAGLTATAKAAPIAQATSATAADTPITANATGSGTPTCLGLRFVRDVTVPDNTEMTPAQVFTKTWLVENSGTCAWKSGFQVTMIGGEALGGSPFKVAQAVGPGGIIQISIKMVAPPNQTGTIQGTWKMSDDKGSFFGDYLSVVIVVSGGTPAASPTIAPTP